MVNRTTSNQITIYPTIYLACSRHIAAAVAASDTTELPREQKLALLKQLRKALKQLHAQLQAGPQVRCPFEALGTLLAALKRVASLWLASQTWHSPAPKRIIELPLFAELLVLIQSIDGGQGVDTPQTSARQGPSDDDEAVLPVSIEQHMQICFGPMHNSLAVHS